MNENGFDFSVVVIGGGPAGSTCANLLAQAGHRVALVERQRFPRFQIGESLNPQMLRVFDRLGVTNAVQRAGFVVKHGALIQCGPEQCVFHFRDGWTKSTRPISYQVNRAEFDKILLDGAAAKGVTLFQPAKVTSVTHSETAQTVRLVEPGEATRDITCRFVIDASGRAQVLAKQNQLQKDLPGLQLRATFAHFKGIPPENPPFGGYFRAHLFKDGWIWFIPLRDGLTSMGVVTNGDHRKPGESNQAHLLRILAEEPVVAERVGGGEIVTPVYCQERMAYDSSSYFGAGFALVGDAAFFVDPVFSTGVYLGVRGAELLAEAVDAYLQQPDAGLGPLQQYQKQMLLHHESVVATVRFFYRALHHQRFARALVRFFDVMRGRSWIVRRFQDFGNGHFAEQRRFMMSVARVADLPLGAMDMLERQP